MSPVKHAVIAAAGLGSRLGRGHPKCLLEVRGKTLLERQLTLLKDVPDVRLVVGFEELQVLTAARAIRSDIIFVRNAAYRSTTTLRSYAMGAAGLASPCLFMDADILFEPGSFHEFLQSCSETEPLIAVTKAKTEDAVFTSVDGLCVTGFSRSTTSDFEWANLCWLPAQYCESGNGAVYERLTMDLPLRYRVVESFEIDTPEDHAAALQHATFI